MPHGPPHEEIKGDIFFTKKGGVDVVVVVIVIVVVVVVVVFLSNLPFLLLLSK